MGTSRRRAVADATACLTHAAALGAIARVDGAWSGTDLFLVLWLSVSALVEHRLRGPDASHEPPPYLLGLAVGATTSLCLALPGTTRPEGALLLACGSIVRALAIATLGRGYGDGIAPVAGRLVTHGPYAFFRHPGELGTVVAMAGMVLLTGSGPGFVALLLGLLPLTLHRWRQEDQALSVAFGAAYEAYAGRVSPRRALSNGRSLERLEETVLEAGVERQR